MTSSNEPRILHLSSPLTWRGGEQQVAYLFEELAALGIEQGLLVAEGSEMERHCLQKDWPHRKAPKKSSLPLRFARALSRYAREENFNLLHAHDSHAHTAAILAHAFFGLSLPLVLSRRVDFPVGKNAFSRFKYNHPSVRKILCVSEAIRQVVARGVRRPERLAVVYSGIDLKRVALDAPGHLRKEYQLSPRQALVGNVAALADHKDYFTFLRTVQLLQKRDCPAAFFIIGTGPQEHEIKSYAAQLGLHKNLYFTGFRNDIPAILPELDILLFTSKTEGLGTSILDAQAAGTPVVATAGGGIPEIVQDGYNGRLCPVGDEVALAAAVEDLLAHPQKAQKIREEAQKAVRRFAKAETARETLRHYRELI